MFLFVSFRFSLIMMVCFLISIFNYANASCTVDTYRNIIVPLSDFNSNNTISSDWVYPKKIVESRAYNGGGANISCPDKKQFVAVASLSNSFGMQNDFDSEGIVKTNIDGIGVYFKWQRNNTEGVAKWLKIPINWYGKGADIFNENGDQVIAKELNKLSTSFRFGLVKYGPTADNFVLKGSDMPCLVASVKQGSNTVEVAKLCFSGSISFNSGTCDIVNTTVQLGKVTKHELDKNVVTNWIDSNIKMSNCSAFYGAFGTNNVAEVKLIPSNGGRYKDGVIFIKDNPNSASGVALQFRNPVSDTILNFDNNVSIKKVLNYNTAKNITIPLQVRYIKEDDVLPGNVNASMTVVVDYK
ncbi:fimbrial protein [Vibrio alginolyticus]|uniref:fimbrial protein n=1 Tax=Vibrio alginolyticus TaxID=663 RepID=UPI003F667396